jgi:hypothetical protein
LVNDDEKKTHTLAPSPNNRLLFAGGPVLPIRRAVQLIPHRELKKNPSRIENQSKKKGSEPHTSLDKLSRYKNYR